jgi:hypothetical protein
MNEKKSQIPFQGHDGTGLDADFEENRAALDARLKADMAGPKSGDIEVSADDTEMKNPDNEFSSSGSTAGVSPSHVEHPRDPEGQQGTTQPDVTPTKDRR